jgi:hypothetical protein
MKFDAPFSLTPALSRWEREKRAQLPGETAMARGTEAFQQNWTTNCCSLSQRERVRVRENASNFFYLLTATGKMPVPLFE